MCWIYRTNEDNSARFVLGEQGESPLVCMGINPSTAEPNKLDPTLRLVKTWSKRLGFDGWIMLNIYPQRATNPNDLHKEFDNNLHEANKLWIYQYLEDQRPLGYTIWAAWGVSITKRRYLSDCLRTIVNDMTVTQNWINIGKKNKDGHPHHPLYLSRKSRVDSFDINQYLISLGQEKKVMVRHEKGKFGNG